MTTLDAPAPCTRIEKERARRLVTAKLRSLRSAAPRVLDLFSGCGGLFLGFHHEGAMSVGGVEIDPLAALSYSTNFHRGPDGVADPRHAKTIDIVTTRPEDVLVSWGHERPEEAVDILVGGPPCPSFARVGRAKLRDIHDDPKAFLVDPRATLYRHYLDWVRALVPVALVMENVPEFLNHGGVNLGETICAQLIDMGYRCRYSILNAAGFGVPQLRERFFLIAIHSEVEAEPDFPTPTHRVDLPQGYMGTRGVAVGSEARNAAHWFIDPPPMDRGLPAVTTAKAISDLPVIPAEERDRRGARHFDRPVAYRTEVSLDPFARSMREWKGFESSAVVVDHVTRCLSMRDYRIFRKMKAGDEYPEACAIARQVFAARVARLSAAGKAPRPGSDAFKDLEALFVPPYAEDKFPNKWRKLDPDAPARTLMAHLGKDGYSHIHYDSDQTRVISVREAARLQSFPDGFRFCGTMNPAFRQIGNSVPPLLSLALARALLARLSVGTRAHAVNG